jgi:hypothetical protein
MNTWDCMDCYDEGVLFWGNGHGEYDTDFCECNKGVMLYNEYTAWYASNEMNEHTLENA